MVGITARGFDVQAEPGGLREAAENVAREARVGVDRELGPRATAEVDGHASQRVVHRHDRVPVACDAAAVAERAVERLAERERGVLGRVVLAGLEVAGTLEHEVEPAVERELLEQMVVEPRAGRHANPSGAIEPEPDGDPRLGGGAEVAGGAVTRTLQHSVARAVRPPERALDCREQQVVVLAIADADPDGAVEQARTTTPSRRSPRPSSSGSSTGTRRKFASDGSGSSPSPRSRTARRSRSSTCDRTSGGSRERRERQ